MKEGTNLESQLLEVRHMPRMKCFTLDLPSSVSKPTFLNVCGLPFSDESAMCTSVINHLRLKGKHGWEDYMIIGHISYFANEITLVQNPNVEVCSSYISSLQPLLERIQKM